MCSPTFNAHVDAMIERVLAGVQPEAEIHLIEIGCGQGAFLRKLALTNKFASLTGFDPAFRGEDGASVADVTIHKRLFGPAALALLVHPVQIIVSRHTIEHIFRPPDFLRTIRAAMEMKPEARLFLETPDIEWIFRQIPAAGSFLRALFNLFRPSASRGVFGSRVRNTFA